jgi:hypothetical protein
LKCYNHPEKDGVAICQACGRVLCHECVRETDAGIACRGECTESLRAEKKLQTELGFHLQNVKRSARLSSFFSIGMGILFILFSNMGFGLVYNFVLLLGIGFTLYGSVALLVNMIIFLKQQKRSKRYI